MIATEEHLREQAKILAYIRPLVDKIKELEKRIQYLENVK